MAELNIKKDISPLGGTHFRPLLRLYYQGEFIEAYRIAPGNNLVGRDISNQVHLDSTFVSRHHFLVELLPNQELRVQDLKSRNGTYLNRKKIQEGGLKHLDRITCGPFEFVCVFPPQLFSEVPAPKADTRASMVVDRSEQTDVGIPSDLADSSRSVSSSDWSDAEVMPHMEVPDFEEAGSTNIHDMPMGLEAQADIPPTLEAEARVMPDRVVLKQKKPSLIKLGLIYGSMILISAGLAYLFFLWRHGMISLPNISPSKPQLEKILGESGQDSSADASSKGEAAKPDRSAASKSAQKGGDQSPQASRKTAPPKAHQVKKEPERATLGVGDTLDSLIEDSPSLKIADNLLARRDVRQGRKTKKNIQAGDKLATMEIVMDPPPVHHQTKNSPMEQSLTAESERYQAELKSKMNLVQSCYIQHAKSVQRAGTIDISLVMGSRGKVVSSKIDTSIFRTKNLDKCISNRLATLSTRRPPWDAYETRFRFKFQGKQTHAF